MLGFWLIHLGNYTEHNRNCRSDNYASWSERMVCPTIILRCLVRCVPLSRSSEHIWADILIAYDCSE